MGFVSPSLAFSGAGEDEGDGTVPDTQMPPEVSQGRLSGARRAELGLSPRQTRCADTSPDNFFFFFYQAQMPSVCAGG